MSKFLAEIKNVLRRKLVGGVLWSTLQAVNNTREYWRWKRRRRHLGRNGMRYEFDPDRIYWVNPQAVVYRTRDPRQKYDYAGAVMDGDWDEWGVRWDDHDHIRWLYQRFVEQISWQETAYFKSCVHLAETGVWRPPQVDPDREERHLVTRDRAGRDDDIMGDTDLSLGALNRRCKDLDDLFESIRRRGVRPQHELLGWNPDPMKRRDNTIIGIGRHGDLLFTDGKHRFAMAHILQLPQVPVRIFQRHQQWVDFRHEIDQVVARVGRLPERMTHVDLQDYNALVEDADDYECIRALLPEHAKSLLCVGAGWGYYCRRFEQDGFPCAAVEADAKSLYFMRKLRRAESLKFDILEMPWSSLKQHSLAPNDVVLVENSKALEAMANQERMRAMEALLQCARHAVLVRRPGDLWHTLSSLCNQERFQSCRLFLAPTTAGEVAVAEFV